MNESQMRADLSRWVNSNLGRHVDCADAYARSRCNKNRASPLAHLPTQAIERGITTSRLGVACRTAPEVTSFAPKIVNIRGSCDRIDSSRLAKWRAISRPV
jgi:hypothetical protein